MRTVFVNYAFDAAVTDPGLLLEQYETARHWADAVARSGAESVTIAQRFSRDADVVRDGVTCLFRQDDGPPVADARTDSRALHAAVLACGPDLVHVNGLMFPTQVRQLRALLPSACAIVIQDHAGLGVPELPWWRLDARLRRRASRRDLTVADAFLFTSVAQGRAWQDAFAIPSDRPIHAVLESSTTMRPVAREPARRQTGVDGSPAFLWVGRLNENKDPLTVVEGFARALSTLPDAQLSMVYGEADLLAAVRARIARSPRLQSRVRLCGRVPHGDMAAWYSAADIFVLGSHAEGSGYALIESLACGCSPAVTDIAPFRAIAADLAPGALWPPGDAVACAAALVRAARIVSAARRDTVRADFEARLSWPAIGRRALAIYKEVAAARAARQPGNPA